MIRIIEFQMKNYLACVTPLYLYYSQREILASHLIQLRRATAFFPLVSFRLVPFWSVRRARRGSVRFCSVRLASILSVLSSSSPLHSFSSHSSGSFVLLSLLHSTRAALGFWKQSIADPRAPKRGFCVKPLSSVIYVSAQRLRNQIKGSTTNRSHV